MHITKMCFYFKMHFCSQLENQLSIFICNINICLSVFFKESALFIWSHMMCWYVCYHSVGLTHHNFYCDIICLIYGNMSPVFVLSHWIMFRFHPAYEIKQCTLRPHKPEQVKVHRKSWHSLSHLTYKYVGQHLRINPCWGRVPLIKQRMKDRNLWPSKQ